MCGHRGRLEIDMVTLWGPIMKWNLWTGTLVSANVATHPCNKSEIQAYIGIPFVFVERANCCNFWFVLRKLHVMGPIYVWCAKTCDKTFRLCARCYPTLRLEIDVEVRIQNPTRWVKIIIMLNMGLHLLYEPASEHTKLLRFKIVWFRLFSLLVSL